MNPQEQSGPPQLGGFKRKNLILIAVITLAVWAFAINTGSVVFMSIIGVLTLVLGGVLVWAVRMIRKQRRLGSMLEGAQTSVEKRREALAALSSGKDKDDVINVFARAQLMSADDPKAGLALLETIDLKKVPAQMQDEVAIMRAQLLLSFGRPKDARPLVDTVNTDNVQRAEARGLFVSIVAESWARTGRHDDALKLLDSVDPTTEPQAQVRSQLMVARAFAQFAAGKKGPVRETLRVLADEDVNNLGRFLMPQFRVHPELQKLARQVADKHPEVRRQAMAQGKQQQRRFGGGQRPR